jgi:hypothetical protein
MSREKDRITEMTDEMSALVAKSFVEGRFEKFDEADALQLIKQDPHDYSTRPCSTCRKVTAMVHQPFGCIRIALGIYLKEKKEQRR